MNRKKILYFVIQSAFKMKINLKHLLFFGLLTVLFSSCRIFNPSVMLRTPKDYPYSAGIDTLPASYIIQKGDRISFRLFSNQGFKIIDLTTLGESGATRNTISGQNQVTYLVEQDSNINLPIIGRTKLAGLNLKDAELFLEDKFSNYYNDPYIMLQVSNRRVIVFPGSGGGARVIPIENEYTSVIEALALVGGIADRGKAHKVKVIRGNYANPEVFKVDLSTAVGFAEAQTYYVRANDIIYVEPSYRPVQQVITATSQVLGFASTILVSLLYIRSFSNTI
ncbi:MAG: polysaccharide biosynthesis/export family protein [Salibacteraceae bacterium]|nr:polysaccharide biosynthesis/export family protein [Salibacteraceae bacterium]